MKKLLLASAISALAAGGAFADEIKVGVLIGFTGPLETITPMMAAGAELAMAEVSNSGLFLGGTTVAPVRADSTCVDASAAQAAAERMITSDGVVAIMGADCSGVTRAILENVAMANGVPMISPSATAPGFSTFNSNGLFYRTAPSDARQGVVLAEIVRAEGHNSVALTHTNNDYGAGFAAAFAEAFQAAGGTVTVTIPHEEAKGDYSAEVASLAAAGGDALVVLGYVDGGSNIIRTAYELGAYEAFFIGDGGYNSGLPSIIGEEAAAATIGTVPSAVGDAAENWARVGGAAGFEFTSSYAAESYDAAALILLAAQAAGEATPAGIAANIMAVANGPGEEIQAGELARGLEILAAGGTIDYVGATNVNFIGSGEAAGSFRQYTFENNVDTTISFH